jgi:hypothetical protein
MGYETTQYLVDIKIKPDSIRTVATTIETRKSKGVKKIQHFID